MLNKFVIFYVPSTKNVGQPLQLSEQYSIIERVATLFSKFFGGATAIPSKGFYTSQSGELVQEDVTLVKSYYEDNIDGEKIARTLAETIKAEYGQESIAIETNSGMLFV